MSTGLAIAIGVIAVLAAAGVFAVAFRRPTREDADWESAVPEGARKADRGPVAVTVAAGTEESTTESAIAVLEEEPPVAPAEPEVVTAEIVEYEEVSEEEQGVNRRTFLKRAMSSMFFFWLAGMGAAYLSFMWPKVQGGFGSDIDAGTVDDILSEVLNSDGTITPLFVPEARSWIVPMTPEEVDGSQFTDNNTVAGGLTALYQTCVHLGCRVPWCTSSQGFECPCHGSKYNGAGEYFAGPAPRNLDRFVVAVNDAGRFIISTGAIVSTARAQEKSVAYPQGPSCI